MRTPLPLAAAAVLAACSVEPATNNAVTQGPAPTISSPEASPQPVLTPTPAPAPARYLGRWAANKGLCEDGAWKFDASHLSTAGEVSCDFDKVSEMPGGYDIAARCLAEGTRSRETIKLRFAESAGAMLVESKTFQPIGLIRCG